MNHCVVSWITFDLSVVLRVVIWRSSVFSKVALLVTIRIRSISNHSGACSHGNVISNIHADNPNSRILVLQKLLRKLHG